MIHVDIQLSISCSPFFVEITLLLFKIIAVFSETIIVSINPVTHLQSAINLSVAINADYVVALLAFFLLPPIKSQEHTYPTIKTEIEKLWSAHHPTEAYQ